MFRNLTIAIAGLGLACSCFASAGSYVPARNGRPDDVRPEKPQKPEDRDKAQHAAGGSSCPVYYGCPPAPPANPKGGGKKGGEPQPAGLHAAGGSSCPVYYNCPPPPPPANPKGGGKKGGEPQPAGLHA